MINEMYTGNKLCQKCKPSNHTYVYIHTLKKPSSTIMHGNNITGIHIPTETTGFADL